MSVSTIDTLRESVRGEVVTPKDEGYGEARKVYNAMIDRHPEAVVRVANIADVVATVNFARDTGQELSIRAVDTVFRASEPTTEASSSTPHGCEASA